MTSLCLASYYQGKIVLHADNMLSGLEYQYICFNTYLNDVK